MKLDARNGDRGWVVYHAEELRQLTGVVWIDDHERQWAQHEVPFRTASGELVLQVFSAKRILVIPASRLVIINPIDDADPESVVTSTCATSNAAV